MSSLKTDLRYFDSGPSGRNASLRSTYANQRDLDENRLYITYSLPLF